MQSFWKKWTCPGLIVRSKWHILIQDSNAVRGKIGIITDVQPGNDNKVRLVTVSYKDQRKGKFTARYTNVERAVHELIMLIAVDEEAYILTHRLLKRP